MNWHYGRLKRDLDLRESDAYVPRKYRRPEYKNIAEYICENTIVCYRHTDGYLYIKLDGIIYGFNNDVSLIEPLDESLKEQPKLGVFKRVYTFLRRLTK